MLIDKFHFKKGKYRPWLIIAPIVHSIFIMCFTKVGGDVVASIVISIGYA